MRNILVERSFLGVSAFKGLKIAVELTEERKFRGKLIHVFLPWWKVEKRS